MDRPELWQSDEALLAACRVEIGRGGGPGGQKRNKTSNRVRLTHADSGAVVTAGEDRSLRVNKLRALRRLRVRLACDLRRPVGDVGEFRPPEWLGEYVGAGGTLRMNAKNPRYPAAVALYLDLLDACRGDPSRAAANAGVSLRSLLRLLAADGHVWRAANDVRARWSLPPLTHP